MKLFIYSMVVIKPCSNHPTSTSLSVYMSIIMSHSQRVRLLYWVRMRMGWRGTDLRKHLFVL